MSILDFFTDQMIPAIPRVYETQIVDGVWEKGLAVDSPIIMGVKYSRSDAERYFSRTWASDVSDLFVTYPSPTIVRDGFLVVDGIEHAIDSIDNVGEQDEAILVGLRVIM